MIRKVLHFDQNVEYVTMNIVVLKIRLKQEFSVSQIVLGVLFTLFALSPANRKHCHGLLVYHH